MSKPAAPVAASSPPAWAVGLAFATIYVVWGLTFLAIRLAIETIPPWTMIGLRSLMAGIILLTVAHWRGASKPTVRDWAAASLVGLLLFAGSHGLLAWAEQHVTSGEAAIFTAMISLWLPLISWLMGVGQRPARRVYAGLLCGLLGVIVLIWPTEARPFELGHAALLASAICWAFGSAVARRRPLSTSLAVATGLPLVAGGALALLASGLVGELARFEVADVQAASWAGLAFLVLFGSVAAFAAFSWLMNIRPPEQVSTYALVNHVIALIAGAVLLDEAGGPRQISATLLIVAAVGWTLRSSAPTGRPADDPETCEASR